MNLSLFTRLVFAFEPIFSKIEPFRSYRRLNHALQENVYLLEKAIVALEREREVRNDIISAQRDRIALLEEHTVEDDPDDYSDYPACGAQDWGYNDDSTVHVYGTCQLPMGHESRYHREMRDGKLWAEWSGPCQRAPAN